MAADGNSVTIIKHSGNFPPPAYATTQWLRDNTHELGTGIALDLETTGLNFNSDKIIEIAFRKFRYHKKNGEVVEVSSPYVELQDPGMSLNPLIQSITGLTDDDLRGKAIDWSYVGGELASADIIIAHNASFDRTFMEKYCAITGTKVWGCSHSQIDWGGHGYPSGKLELLCIHHGFFVEAHRALNDVDALLQLISTKSSLLESTYLLELLTNAFRPTTMVIARNSPFETKDLLKERGYFWNTGAKSWQKRIYRDKVEEEIQWLEISVYKGRFRGEVRELSPTETFRQIQS